MFGKKVEEDKNEIKDDKEEVQQEYGSMKNGDYMIHVYIQEGKQFKLDQAQTSNPMISVTVTGKNKYTTSKNDVARSSNVYWGEHLFFEKNNVSKNDIESTQIQIRALNKGVFKDDVIGAYDFDVTYVYFQEKHTIFNSWIALSNPESEHFNDITCYLKIAISVIGPGDDQVILNDSSAPATEEEEVLMPPSIRKVYKQLKLRFIKAERLPKMDTLGTIDAFIKTVYLKKKIKTKPVTQSKDTHETFIEQEFWLPIQWPLASDRLVLKVADKDPVGSELVGSMAFSLKELITEAGSTGFYKWYNVYGSPLGVSGENTDKMNKYDQYASTWKGRILMQVTCEDTNNPIMKSEPIPIEVKKAYQQSKILEKDEFEIIAEVGSAICLPDKKKYTVKIKINDLELQTDKPIECQGNFNRWSQRFALQTITTPYKSLEQLGRVYVYLMEGDTPICFWQGLASEFKEPNAAYRWVPMQFDQAIKKVKKTWEAGLVQIKLCINHKSLNGQVNFNQYASWGKRPPKRLHSYKIRTHIFQCKDIPAADKDGTSDPYITLWNFDDKKIKTRVIEDNNNPIFFQTLETYYQFDEYHNAAPIVLNLWDKDQLTDDYLGRCVIPLATANISNDDEIPVPKWYDIKLGFSDSDPSCGQMLLSFTVVNDDYNFKIPIQELDLTQQIAYREFNIEINVLGLRNLQSIGIMPVKKPFIKFNLRSLLPPEKAEAVTNVKTQPSSQGNNPNINTVINFSIELPENALYCPKLQCDVYDYVFKGMMQPLLGTFSISIGDIMQQLIQEQNDLLEDSYKIITDLKVALRQCSDAKRQQSLNKLTLSNQYSHFKSQRERSATLGPLLEKALKEEEQESSLNSNFSSQDEGEEGDEVNDFDRMAQTALRQDFRRQAVQNSFLRRQSTQVGEVTSRLAKNLGIEFQSNLAIEKEKMKEQEKKMREQEIQRLKEEGVAIHKNIVFPMYYYDERLKVQREQNPKPSASLYKEIGFDQKPPEIVHDGNKHYRKYYDTDLEQVKDIFPKKVFHQSDVIRGQTRGVEKSFFSWKGISRTDDSGQFSTQKIVGYFKGRINIENKKDKEEFERLRNASISYIINNIKDIHQKVKGTELDFRLAQLESFEESQRFARLLDELGLANLGIMKFLKQQSYTEMISRMLLIKTRCLIRLYLLEGHDFAQKDVGSPSDPYMKIKCGKKKYDERQNYQLDEPNPKFYKLYEFEAEFPGAPPLEIKAYDYDDLFGDDLIGETLIDLDDRFFSPEWQQLDDKPIEQRPLYHPSSQVGQGSITCWVEIHPNISDLRRLKVFDITPQPQLDYQVRLVIYDTEDVPCEDAEGTSDVFIKAHFDDKDKKETDTHFRCQTGSASFNYRLLYDVKAPRTNYNLTLQVWDRDLFKSNDFIGEIQLPLQHVFEDAILTQKPIDINQKYYTQYLQEHFKKMNIENHVKVEFQDEESFFVTTYKDGQYTGRVRIGLTIVPGDFAKSSPVGLGRSEPNHSPFLNPPVGRLSLSLNPFKMLNQLVGPAFRRKIYGFCFAAICMTLCIFMFPMIASNVVSQMILSIL